MSDKMRTLYLTMDKPSPLGGIAYAISDDGTVLATHFCSHRTFMYGDLYGRRKERASMWEEHFGGKEGEAFEVVDLGYELPPDEVLAKNRARGEKDGAA